MEYIVVQLTGHILLLMTFILRTCQLHHVTFKRMLPSRIVAVVNLSRGCVSRIEKPEEHLQRSVGKCYATSSGSKSVVENVLFLESRSTH